MEDEDRKGQEESMEDSPKQEEDSVKSKKPTKQSDKPVVNSSKNASDSSSGSRKSKNFRQATHHLREEALRRYRLKHQATWKDYSPPQSASKRKTKSKIETRKKSGKTKDSEVENEGEDKPSSGVEDASHGIEDMTVRTDDVKGKERSLSPQSLPTSVIGRPLSRQDSPKPSSESADSKPLEQPGTVKQDKDIVEEFDNSNNAHSSENLIDDVNKDKRSPDRPLSDFLDEAFKPGRMEKRIKSGSTQSSDDGKRIDEIASDNEHQNSPSERKSSRHQQSPSVSTAKLDSPDVADQDEFQQGKETKETIHSSSKNTDQMELSRPPSAETRSEKDSRERSPMEQFHKSSQSGKVDEISPDFDGQPGYSATQDKPRALTSSPTDIGGFEKRSQSPETPKQQQIKDDSDEVTRRKSYEENDEVQQNGQLHRESERSAAGSTPSFTIGKLEDDQEIDDSAVARLPSGERQGNGTKSSPRNSEKLFSSKDENWDGWFDREGSEEKAIGSVNEEKPIESTRPKTTSDQDRNDRDDEHKSIKGIGSSSASSVPGDANKGSPDESADEVEVTDTTEPMEESVEQSETATVAAATGDGSEVQNDDEDKIHEKALDIEAQEVDAVNVQVESESAGDNLNNNADNEPPAADDVAPDEPDTEIGQHQTEEPEQQNVAEVEQLPAEEVDQQETEVEQAAEAADEKETKDGEEKEEDEAAEAIQKQRDDETSDKTAADDEDVDETVKPEMDEKQDAEKEKQDDEAADAEQEELAHEIDEEENTIPEDFYYDKKDHISKALIADESGLPDDMISLLHSFGYDCTKRSNLHLLDEKTIVFVAGNYVELIDLQTKEQSYIRSTSGGGIGAIAVHPSRQFLAVAEKGTAPNINIYEFPSLKLYRILRGGTEAAYAYVDFSPDGKLLASVGGDPDYMLTIWNWKQERIVLRSKAFSQDVFRVTFSTELEGQLTSSGTGHIRFWKMARTFTGLKLQGQLGKFGRTEISDIEGYVELPDGKVLSGSEWGNMLLWDGGLIKVEISRKNHKPCHHGAIQQIVMDEGELMTVGIDGCIRVWDFETIDTADVIDETGIFEMEPMNELQIGNGDVHLKSIVKSVDPDEPTMWYAQDANGGIWKLDLSFSHTSLAPEKILSYHAGAIRGCDTSPVSHLVATAGADCTVRVYDYTTHTQLCESKYTSGGTTLLWPPETVDPKGSSVIAGFEDGVVRVLRFQKKLDIDLGKRSKDTSELVLFQAFKPHIKSVTAFAIDNSGDLLATGSDDCTVFFLTVGRQMEEFYDPIGFVTTPAPVTHLHWSPGNFDKNTLLIFMNDGQVMEIDAPEPGNFDTSKTYQITGLASRLYQFNSCKSQLRHDEEMARKKKEEEERLRIEEEERRKRKERGQIDSDDEENEVAEERKRKRKEKEEDWSPFIPEEPCAILHGFYSTDSNKFWISMDGFDAGYLYECEFGSDKPLRALPVTNSNDVAIQNMKFTNDKRQLLMGLKDGSIRVQSLSAESDDIVDFDTYWTLAMHDNHYGTIDQLALSYDNQFLFTVGHDGNFFTYSMMSQQELEEKIAAAKAKIPSARKPDEMKMTDDIDDPSAYSIEDAKQKAEHDRMMKLADLKKQDVRQTIAQLRHKFKKLLHMNDDLPAHLQLTRQEFEMDPEIKKDLERQTSEKIDIVRKELAWEAEKHRIALEKLKQKFKDIVECDRIVLKAFLTPHEICSYRAAKLSDDFYQLKAEMERRKTTMTTRDDMSRDPTSMLKGRRDVTDGSERERSGTQSDGQIKTTLKGSMGERINKALAKVEEKKRKRALRRSQWNDLYEGKPDDDYEDPADVAAIKEAQENMGDYKLKTAPDYVVPDHLRMNAEKARNRLLILKDLIHHHKYEFNQQLLSLRDKKIRIIDEIKQLVDKLQVVQSKLPETERRPVPSIPKMHPDELPEKKLEYTKDMLLKFKKEMEEKALQELKTGGFGANQFAAPKREATTPASPLPLFRQQTSASAPAEENDDDDDEDADIGPSSLEIQLQKVEEIKLMYERDRLLTRIDNLLKTFDAELRVIRHKKFKSEINMKNADLRQVTLFEELVLLKEFEKSENVLADKMEAKQQEKLDMQAKVLECQQKLDSKRKDIERYQEKERALHAMFLASLGDNNKFAEYLTKVFKKKIKRTKKKATEGEDSEEESDEESDDESDWSDEDEESDEEAGGGLDLDVCPPGCDQSIYDSTCQLREKRLDIEEALTEEKKLNEQFKRDLESLQRKAKVIDGALKTAEGDLEAFQLEKQQKLNELDMVVTLKLHQIQHIVNNAMPQDLTNCLVFESTGLVRLQHRIKELEHEKQLQKKQMKEAKRKHVELIKDRRLFEQRISEMDEQCNHMMQQKFGRIVDLEKLEQVTVNRNLEELKERLRQKEADCANEIAKWEDKIGVKKDRITDLIRENTNRLEQLNMLLGEKKDYEGELDSRQKNLGGEYSGSRKADIHERQRLIQLVQLQAQEIEALKDEITLLSRKGGHILPPAQPPMPQSRTISNINT